MFDFDHLPERLHEANHPSWVVEIIIPSDARVMRDYISCDYLSRVVYVNRRFPIKEFIREKRSTLMNPLVVAWTIKMDDYHTFCWFALNMDPAALDCQNGL